MNSNAVMHFSIHWILHWRISDLALTLLKNMDCSQWIKLKIPAFLCMIRTYVWLFVTQMFTFFLILSVCVVYVFVFHLLIGTGTGTIVRPKAHYTRPPHPPPDPPIPEACATGPSEPRASLFFTHEPEHTKQRHSYPERLVRSRSTDIVCAGRRPNSDPGINRRIMVEDQDQAVAFATGSTTSPIKDSLKVEVCRTCYLKIVLYAPVKLPQNLWKY